MLIIFQLNFTALAYRTLDIIFVICRLHFVSIDLDWVTKVIPSHSWAFFLLLLITPWIFLMLHWFITSGGSFPHFQKLYFFLRTQIILLFSALRMTQQKFMLIKLYLSSCDRWGDTNGCYRLPPGWCKGCKRTGTLKQYTCGAKPVGNTHKLQLYWQFTDCNRHPNRIMGCNQRFLYLVGMIRFRATY